DLMRRPVRRFVPQIARDHVRLAVAVDVGDRDAFRAEFAVELNLLEPNFSRRFLRADAGMELLRRRRRRQGEANRQNHIDTTAWKRTFHFSFSWRRFSLRTCQEHLQPLSLACKLSRSTSLQNRSRNQSFPHGQSLPYTRETTPGRRRMGCV